MLKRLWYLFTAGSALDELIKEKKEEVMLQQIEDEVDFTTNIVENFKQKIVDEEDPNGISASTPGAKLDAGKPMVDDILSGFPRALMAIAKVGTFGANKYTLNGWQSVDNGVRRYRNAAGRHRLYVQKGEILDNDSGLPHRWHEAWNVLAALELEMRGAEVIGSTGPCFSSDNYHHAPGKLVGK